MHWIMDDGYWSKKGVSICTECFTLEEVRLLQKRLKNKLNLSTVLNKHCLSKGISKGYRLSVRQKENLKMLTALIQPHIHPITLYKLNVKEPKPTTPGTEKLGKERRKAEKRKKTKHKKEKRERMSLHSTI